MPSLPIWASISTTSAMRSSRSDWEACLTATASALLPRLRAGSHQLDHLVNALWHDALPSRLENEESGTDPDRGPPGSFRRPRPRSCPAHDEAFGIRHPGGGSNPHRTSPQRGRSRGGRIPGGDALTRVRRGRASRARSRRQHAGRPAATRFSPRMVDRLRRRLDRLGAVAVASSRRTSRTTSIGGRPGAVCRSSPTQLGRERALVKPGNPLDVLGTGTDHESRHARPPDDRRSTGSRAGR